MRADFGSVLGIRKRKRRRGIKRKGERKHHTSILP
jgi:hypothetical protein